MTETTETQGIEVTGEAHPWSPPNFLSTLFPMFLSLDLCASKRPSTRSVLLSTDHPPSLSRLSVLALCFEQ